MSKWVNPRSNSSDHELGTHRSVEYYIYKLELFHKLLQISENLKIISIKILRFISPQNKLNGLDYKNVAHRNEKINKGVW